MTTVVIVGLLATMDRIATERHLKQNKEIIR